MVGLFSYCILVKGIKASSVAKLVVMPKLATRKSWKAV